MKKIVNILSVLCAVGLVAGCVENEAYSNGYYSSGGYARAHWDDVTSGYNRNYHNRIPQQNHNGYSSRASAPNQGYTSSATKPNNARTNYSSGAKVPSPSQPGVEPPMNDSANGYSSATR